MLMNKELSFFEFKAFYDSLGKYINEEEFETNLRSRFNSTEKGVTL